MSGGNGEKTHVARNRWQFLCHVRRRKSRPEGTWFSNRKANALVVVDNCLARGTHQPRSGFGT